MRILFICKKNETYGFQSYTRRSSGLYNSTRFIVESLASRGIHAKIVEVNDNNDIDREVTLFKPNRVIIEALWVVPEKFDVLKPLHPEVDWFVHMHSGMPFLALEGIAMGWLHEYAKNGIGIIANSPESYEAFKCVFNNDRLVLLPNVYLSTFSEVKPFRSKNRTTIDIGCFGAVRPMKNHLLQAMAAIRFADENGLRLHFHINGSRLETNGDPVLKNLIHLFAGTEGVHSLIRHHWMEPEEFLEALHRSIDIGMQVSLTETFNVVSADYVTAGLPIVVSKEVKWASRFSKAEDDSVDSIVSALYRVAGSKMGIRRNQHLLRKYSKRAQEMWFEFTRTTF